VESNESRTELTMKEVLHQPIFAQQAFQDFICEWVKKCDNISIKFSSDIQKPQFTTENNSTKIILSDSTTIWQLPQFFEQLEATYGEAGKSIASKAKYEIETLASTIHLAGQYLHKYSSQIKVGKEYIDDISSAFIDIELPKTLSKSPQINTEEQDESVKKWLVGSEKYERLMKTISQLPIEERAQYSDRVQSKLIEQSMRRLVREYDAQLHLPQQDASQLGYKIESGVYYDLENKKFALVRALFEKGLNTLLNTIKSVQNKNEVMQLAADGIVNIEDFIKSCEIILYKELDIDSKKSELIELKKHSVSPETISKKEYEFALEVQQKVMSIPYNFNKNDIVDSINTNTYQCILASLIGGKLLQELGIEVRGLRLNTHLGLLIITNDKKIYNLEMQSDRHNQEISAENFDGTSKEAQRNMQNINDNHPATHSLNNVKVVDWISGLSKRDGQMPMVPEIGDLDDLAMSSLIEWMKSTQKNKVLSNYLSGDKHWRSLVLNMNDIDPERAKIMCQEWIRLQPQDIEPLKIYLKLIGSDFKAGEAVIQKLKRINNNWYKSYEVQWFYQTHKKVDELSKILQLYLSSDAQNQRDMQNMERLQKDIEFMQTINRIRKL